MCGIFGIYGHENAAAMAHLGLYSLQHRGQESSGIVAVDRETGARAIKSMGLVSEGVTPSGTRATARPALLQSRMLSQSSPGSATDT
jgi:amidophosphoribosyltransferase